MYVEERERERERGSGEVRIATGWFLSRESCLFEVREMVWGKRVVIALRQAFIRYG